MIRDFWQIPLIQGQERLRVDNAKVLNPTQKLEEILKRVILASPNKDNVMLLGPFSDSGTTAYIAKKYDRKR